MKLFICLIILTGFFFSQPVSALEENLMDVNVVKYSPQPVEPGKNFDIWIKVTNIGNNDIINTDVEIVPASPFLFQNGETGKRDIPIIIKGDSLTYRFSMKLDENAMKGNNKISFGTRINNMLTTREFDIQVGYEVSNVKGVIEVEKYQINPEVLMSGDVAQITLTLKNSASDSSLKFDGKDYSTNSQVQSITMLNNRQIEVLSDSYSNVGTIGPGAKFEAHFTVRANEITQNGIYFADYEVVGSSNLRGKIPLKIDNSYVEIIPVETSETSISLNIANQRSNTIEAVSIIPVANNTVFVPSQYFIGIMQPNEVSTIKFEKKGDQNEVLMLKARFKNDANWHESEIKIISPKKIVESSQVKPEQYGLSPGGYELSIGIITITMLLGFYTYMSKRRMKKT